MLGTNPRSPVEQEHLNTDSCLQLGYVVFKSSLGVLMGGWMDGDSNEVGIEYPLDPFNNNSYVVTMFLSFSSITVDTSAIHRLVLDAKPSHLFYLC